MNIKEYNHNGHTFLTVSNSKNLTITFCDYGASVYAIKYKDNYVTYHPESYDEFIESKRMIIQSKRVYIASTFMPAQIEIKDGKIEIDGKTYDLDKNEHGNTLHGGNTNFSFQIFNYEVNENDETINVVFKFSSPAGECGFPADVNIIIVYAISKLSDKFKIHYHAMPDAATPLNISSHIYWRLGGKDILKHTLSL